MVFKLKKILLVFLSLLLSFQLAFSLNSLEYPTNLLNKKDNLLILKKELEKDSIKLKKKREALGNTALWSTLIGIGIGLAIPLIGDAFDSNNSQTYFYSGLGVGVTGLAIGATTFSISLGVGKKQQKKDKEIQDIENRILEIEQKKLINKYKFRAKEHYYSNIYIALSNISKKGSKQVDKEVKKLISLYGDLYNLNDGTDAQLGKLFLFEELLDFYRNYKQSKYFVFENIFTEAQKEQKIEAINKNEKKGKYKDLTILADATKKIKRYLENNKIELDAVVVDVGREVLVNEKEIMEKLLLPFKKKENELKLKSMAIIGSLAGDDFYNYIMNKVRHRDYNGLMAFYEAINIRHGVKQSDFNYQPSITVRVQNIKIYWGDVDESFSEYSGKYIFSKIVDKDEFRKLFYKLDNFDDLSYRYCFSINERWAFVESDIVLKNKNNMLKYKKGQGIKAKFNFYEGYALEKDIIKK